MTDIPDLITSLETAQDDWIEWKHERLFGKAAQALRDLQAVAEAARIIVRNTGLDDIRTDCCLVKIDLLEDLEIALAKLDKP